MSTGDLQQKLRTGIDAAKRGDRATARRMLEQVIGADDSNEMAWLWLASVVNTAAERRTCLERVLQINPRNERAREALRRLNSPGTPTEDLRTRQTIDQLRRRPAPGIRATGNEGGGTSVSTSTIIVIGLFVTVGLAALAIVSALNPAPPAPPATATVDIFLATEETNATLLPTETAISSPTRTPVTPVDLNSITRRAPTLPPTFTATVPPTATEVPTETPAPPGLETFEVLYASLNPGADEPDMYSMFGDGSLESFYLERGRDVAFDPRGILVAFVRNVTDETNLTAPEIFVVDYGDPSNLTQITNLRAPDTAHPSWSPDGRQIVFSSSYQSTAPELWVVSAAGGEPRRLTENEAIDREPSWSPTGDLIAYSSDINSPGFLEVYTTTSSADAATRAVTQLTDNARSSYSPSWSSDGTRITFVSDRTGDADIYTMDANGQGETLITFDDGEAEDRRPTFSPDGRWVFFISNRDSENFQLFALSSDGNALYRVLENQRDEDSIVFRPVAPPQP